MDQFLKELRELWDSLPGKLWFVVLLVAWVALFHVLGNSSFGYVQTSSLFGWLTGWYRLATVGESDDEICPYVPWLVLVLFLRQRTELTRVAKRPWGPALILVAAGLLIHGVGYLAQHARISLIGFLVGAYGLFGVCWGWQWLKAVFFPYFLLIFAIPLEAYADPVTFRLRLWATSVAVGLCRGVFQMNIVQKGTSAFHPADRNGPGFSFEVAAACSGIRSATMVQLLTFVFAFVTLKRTSNRVLLSALAVPLAVAGNIVRLVVVFVIGDLFGQQAGAAVETRFGFITYGAALGLAFWIGTWLQKRELREEAAEARVQVSAGGAPVAVSGEGAVGPS